MNPTDLPLMHQILEELKKVQVGLGFSGIGRSYIDLFFMFQGNPSLSKSTTRCEFYTEFSDHVSLHLSADKCDRRSAIPKASTRFSSQHSAVSHFVNCRFFPTGMTCGDMAE
ncbi:uncharacterized protein LOC143449073 isoform X3 [Clavelina lepadiformis]|uniref:uncharacterized protein LOC143449073 isoform X3 n=1 Tax=Clavelina lepadiformis TaxID=159417 RepID=UPI004042BF8F